MGSNEVITIKDEPTVDLGEELTLFTPGNTTFDKSGGIFSGFNIRFSDGLVLPFEAELNPFNIMYTLDTFTPFSNIGYRLSQEDFDPIQRIKKLKQLIQDKSLHSLLLPKAYMLWIGSNDQNFSKVVKNDDIYNHSFFSSLRAILKINNQDYIGHLPQLQDINDNLITHDLGDSIAYILFDSFMPAEYPDNVAYTEEMNDIYDYNGLTFSQEHLKVHRFNIGMVPKDALSNNAVSLTFVTT